MKVHKAISPSPLLPDEVHVWFARFESGALDMDAIKGYLSPSEIARAGRFRFSPNRDRFMFFRGILRYILGRYLDIPPIDVCLDVTKTGKPVTAHQLGNQELCFNVSHSGDLAVYIFALRRSVGIDLEQIRSMPDIDKMAETCLSPKEKEAFHLATSENRTRLFLQYWTRQEAYQKARGDGLAIPISTLDFSELPVPTSILTRFNSGIPESTKWFMADFFSTPEYVAAMVVEDRGSEKISSEFYNYQHLP